MPQNVTFHLVSGRTIAFLAVPGEVCTDLRRTVHEHDPSDTFALERHEDSVVIFARQVEYISFQPVDTM